MIKRLLDSLNKNYCWDFYLEKSQIQKQKNQHLLLNLNKIKKPY
jgi:hypothetical protein